MSDQSTADSRRFTSRDYSRRQRCDRSMRTSSAISISADGTFGKPAEFGESSRDSLEPSLSLLASTSMVSCKLGRCHAPQSIDSESNRRQRILELVRNAPRALAIRAEVARFRRPGVGRRRLPPPCPAFVRGASRTRARPWRGICSRRWQWLAATDAATSSSRSRRAAGSSAG